MEVDGASAHDAAQPSVAETGSPLELDADAPLGDATLPTMDATVPRSDGAQGDLADADATPAQSGDTGATSLGSDTGLPNQEPEPEEPPAVPHAQLCPHATPGVGIPAPVNGAKPVRLNALVEFLESPIGTARDFGVSTPYRLELIENQLTIAMLRVPRWLQSDASPREDRSNGWPDWLEWEYDRSTNGLLLKVRASSLRRGTYHVTLPFAARRPFAPDEPLPIDLIVRVRGMGFMTDRAAVPHYVGDAADRPVRVTLAGGDSAWRITDMPDWLRVARSEGSSLAQAQLELQRQPAFASMAPGHSQGRLCVENQRGDATSIAVYALVERPSLRPLYTQRFLYSFASSEQSSSYNYVFTDLSEQVMWQATSAASWLTLRRATGMTNQRFDFDVDASGLADGYHTTTVEVTDPTGKNEGTRFVVHYVKDQRLSTWGFARGHRHSAFSPISPHGLAHEEGALTIHDVFRDTEVQIPVADAFAQAVISEHSARLHVLARAGSDTQATLSSYGWPGLQPLGSRPSQPAHGSSLDRVRRVLGREYWEFTDAIVSLDDGRSGTLMPAQSAQRRRLRVYDDGTTLFGFFEELGEPQPEVYPHWAHGPGAFCIGNNAGPTPTFECRDQTGVYLRVAPEAQLASDIVNYRFMPTHQGGFYLAQGSSPILAFSAQGQPLAPRPHDAAEWPIQQWGDTLMTGATRAWALNYLFEPQSLP